MTIFLGYGLLLGLVGAVLGSSLGLTITDLHQRNREVADQAHRPADLRPQRSTISTRFPTDIQPLIGGAGQPGSGGDRGALQRSAGVAGGAAASGDKRCGMNDTRTHALLDASEALRR